MVLAGHRKVKAGGSQPLRPSKICFLCRLGLRVRQCWRLRTQLYMNIWQHVTGSELGPCWSGLWRARTPVSGVHTRGCGRFWRQQHENAAPQPEIHQMRHPRRTAALYMLGFEVVSRQPIKAHVPYTSRRSRHVVADVVTQGEWQSDSNKRNGLE